MIKYKNTLIKNIYYMLAYAFTSLNLLRNDKIAAEEFDNIHNLFAAILSNGISRQLKQGLNREYIPANENLTVMHGKINFSETIKNAVERKRLLSCEYDELSENTIFNRILKSTAILLIKHKGVSNKYRDQLKKEMLFFSNVDIIDLKSVRWADIRFNRNTQNYKMLISICQLIAEGMLLTDEKGGYKLASFIDDQRKCRLFEKFILEYYKKEHPELKASASQIKWALDAGESTFLPTMQSDIMLENKEKSKVLIIDAKYYGSIYQKYYDKASFHSGNLYQIFTYVKNKASEPEAKYSKVSGMLLYAETEESIQPDNSYLMSGNTIAVKSLDLNREFSDIAKSLDDIAEEYLGEEN